MARVAKKLGAPNKPTIAATATLISVGEVKRPDETKIAEKAEAGKPAFSSIPLKFKIAEDYPFQEFDYRVYFDDTMLDESFDPEDHRDNLSYMWAWRGFFGDTEKPTALDALVEDQEDFWETVDNGETKADGLREAFLNEVGRTFGVFFTQETEKIADPDGGKPRYEKKDRYSIIKDRFNDAFFGTKDIQKLEQRHERQMDKLAQDPTHEVRFKIAWEEGAVDDLDFDGFTRG